MADSLRNDPEILRSCILYEILRGKSVEKAYKNVCKVMGDDAIEFLDFDFLYYRLYHGNYDMNYDRKLDPKSLLFSELPADAIGKVMEKLKLREQLKLRKVSHGFRYLVDEQKLAYKTIRMDCTSDYIWVYFNGKKIAYTDTVYSTTGCLVRSNVIKNDSVEKAFHDMTIALKNPKVKLLFFHFGCTSSLEQENEKQNAITMYGRMRNLLKTFNHKMSVKSLNITARSQEDVLMFMKFLKPGILESIYIGFVPENPSSSVKSVAPKFVNIDEIITLDQWKMAKHVEINTSVSVPIENFFHFKSFYIKLDSDLTETLIYLRDNLPKLTEIPKCYLRVDYDLNALDYYEILGPDYLGYSPAYCYPDSGSDKPLYFAFNDRFVSIYHESHF